MKRSAMKRSKIEAEARRILAENGVEGEPHPMLLADTMNEVEYQAQQDAEQAEATLNEEARASVKQRWDYLKTYYVVGRDSVGVKRTVKTEARSVAEARSNASWILATPGRVHRG